MTNATPRPDESVLVVDQRKDVVAFEPLPAVQELKFDDKSQTDHLAAELLDEVDLRSRRPARGEQVVVDDHARSRLDRVGMELQGVEAVLEGVLDAHGAPRQLARLSGCDEPALEAIGERRTQDKAARLGAKDEF